MLSQRSIHTYPEHQVWQKASKRLIEVVDESLKTKQKTAIFLSGGSVVRMYGGLAEYIKHLGRWQGNDFDSSEVESIKSILQGVRKDSSDGGITRSESPPCLLAQVDERFKAKNYESRVKNQELRRKDINALAIEKTSLWKMCELKNIPYYIISQKGNLSSSASKYNQSVSKIFKKTLSLPTPSMRGNRIAILGIGPDCHTAGLLPGYQDKWDVRKYVVGYKNKGQYKKRITLTPYALERLDYAIVVAGGKGKKQAIQDALVSSHLGSLNEFPAAVIQKIKRVDLFTDCHINSKRGSTSFKTSFNSFNSFKTPAF